ncbi:MAG: cyclic nucleotide-binding domain-containing protein [Anaerolineae bacterium]|nr:cyclic nucleotide-binding domain-containing protein [Anaerolineae bacterium]
MQLISVLRQVDIFYELKEEHLQKLAEVCREIDYKENDTIVQENTPSDEIFIIVKGTVDIVLDPSLLGTYNKRAEPLTIVTLWPGQTLGEIGLVDRGMRSASAKAATDDTKLLAISRDDLVRLCEESHEMGYILMRNIASDLAFKVRHTDLMLREQLFWESPSKG